MHGRLRRAAVAVCAAAALLTAGGTVRAGDPGRFRDHGDWPEWAAYYGADTLAPSDGELVEAIRFEFVSGREVDRGYRSREFQAEAITTRAEMAAILARSLGIPITDVPGGQWYEPYVKTLQLSWIIPQDAPDDWTAQITRLEAGQWFGRAANVFHADDKPIATPPVDVSDPLFLRAIRAGVFKSGNGVYTPDRVATRTQAAVMAVRLAKARNARGNQADHAVQEQLKTLIKSADRQAWERERLWADQGVVGRTPTEGIRTDEFAAYLSYRAVLNLESKVTARWHEPLPDTYAFKYFDLHDSIGTILVCASATVYMANGEAPYAERYCERQFVLLRDGKWVLASAAGPAPQSK